MLHPARSAMPCAGNRPNVRFSNLFTSLALAAVAANAAGAELRVPDAYSSIGAAVAAAAAGDTILVGPGTYGEHLTIPKRLKLRSTDGAGSTVIDAGRAGSAVVFLHARRDGLDLPELTGFTIRNGYSQEGQGGGVTVFDSDAVIQDNVIEGNESTMDGGGVLINASSNATIRDNEVSGNSAYRFGGGIFIVGHSSPTIAFNRILNNNASGAIFDNGGSSGGGIFSDDHSAPQIVWNEIRGNSADFAGGGLALRVQVAALVESNDIVDNASAYGGGIHLETEGSSPYVRGNTIEGNKAIASPQFAGSGYGGGISIYNLTKPEIVGNIIASNFATMGGGGMVCAEQAQATISSNTISANSTTITENGDVHQGGGVYVANSTATMTNNVIASNQSILGGGIALIDGAQAIIQNDTIVGNQGVQSGGRPASGGGIFVHPNIASATISNSIISGNNDFQVFEERKTATFADNLINNDGLGIYFNYDTHGVHDVAALNTSHLADFLDAFSGNEGFKDATAGLYAIDATSAAIDRAQPPLLSPLDALLRPRDNVPDVGAFEQGAGARAALDVYRFWSDIYHHHFYTLSRDEAQQILETHSNPEWRYEGVPFRAFSLDNCIGQPVYRFWSDRYRGHFYTISEAEKNYIIATYDSSEWRYEGAAFCAATSPGAGLTPLYRFWSDRYHGHFYTANVGEKDQIIATYPESEWRYEGVAFYVVPAQ